MPIHFSSDYGRPGEALFRSLSQASQYATLLPAVYSGFAWQSCCMAGTMKMFCIRKDIFSHRKRIYCSCHAICGCRAKPLFLNVFVFFKHCTFIASRQFASQAFIFSVKGPLKYLLMPLLGKNQFAITLHMFASIGPNLDNSNRKLIWIPRYTCSRADASSSAPQYAVTVSN